MNHRNSKMYSFSLENLVLPFELTKEESLLFLALESTLEITKQKKPANLKETEIKSVKNFPPEQMIKFLLIDTSLLRATEHEELKIYWREYIESYQYLYHTTTYNFLIRKKTLPTLQAHQSYPIKLRDDFSYAKQAIALFCLFQDKNFAGIRDEEIRHQWRVLAAKYGSLHGTIRAVKTAATTIFNSPSYIPNDDDIKIINDTLNLLADSILIHGAAGLYILSYFCVSVRKRFGDEKKLDPLYDCALTAFSLANQTVNLSDSQLSLNNVTFGKPENFYQMNFSDKNISEIIDDVKTNLGQTKVARIANEVEDSSFLLSALFVQHQRTPENSTEFRTLLNIPSL